MEEYLLVQVLGSSLNGWRIGILGCSAAILYNDFALLLFDWRDLKRCPAGKPGLQVIALHTFLNTGKEKQQ